MPHAASGRLQQDIEAMVGKDDIKFQCRTRQVVGCNENDGNEYRKHCCFNAARGKWSVATICNDCGNSGTGYGFNAARGRWSVATKRKGVGITLIGTRFQCRTRQVVGCNLLPLELLGLMIPSFNAARGKWSVATAPCRKPHDT